LASRIARSRFKGPIGEPGAERYLGKAGDTVHPDLFHQRLTVRADRLQPQLKHRCDVLARFPCGDQSQHLLLSRRQPVERPGDLSGSHVALLNPGQDVIGNLRTEIGAAFGNGSQRVQQIGRRHLLQQEGSHSGAKRSHHATRYARVVNVVNILVVTVIAVGLLAHSLKKSLLQSREAEREIRALSARLINAQEEERTRIARELHDDLSQQVAAMSIGMGILKSQIPPQQVDARAQSDRIQQKLVNVAGSIRRLSHELHPAVLEHSGLAAALQTYCSEFGLLTGVRVSLQSHGSFEGVPIPVALCVYRITQEALQNVAKHANVGEAEVELTRSDGILCLSVSDRGAGIETVRATPRVGLGLVSIKERTRLVNGAFEIQSKPNQGTTVLVRIPA
jgi:signal transduction histidine kinase